MIYLIVLICDLTNSCFEDLCDIPWLCSPPHQLTLNDHHFGQSLGCHTRGRQQPLGQNELQGKKYLKFFLLLKDFFTSIFFILVTPSLQKKTFGQ